MRLAQLREDLFVTASEGEVGGWCGWEELISVTEVIQFIVGLLPEVTHFNLAKSFPYTGEKIHSEQRSKI